MELSEKNNPNRDTITRLLPHADQYFIKQTRIIDVEYDGDLY